METDIEFSGATVANLYRIFAELEDDALLGLVGERISSSSIENSDAQTSANVIRHRFIVNNFIFISFQEEKQLLTGNFNDLSDNFVGFLRFRKNFSILMPSFNDRRIMKELATKKYNCIFMVANEDQSRSLGVRYNMTSYLVDKPENICQKKTNILFPCLGAKSQYRKSSDKSVSRELLVVNVDVDTALKDVIDSFETVSKNFHKNVEEATEEVLELESEKHKIEKRVDLLASEIDKELQKQIIQIGLKHKNLQSSLDAVIDESSSDVNISNMLW